MHMRMWGRLIKRGEVMDWLKDVKDRGKKRMWIMLKEIECEKVKFRRDAVNGANEIIGQIRSHGIIGEYG